MKGACAGQPYGALIHRLRLWGVGHAAAFETRRFRRRRSERRRADPGPRTLGRRQGGRLTERQRRQECPVAQHRMAVRLSRRRLVLAARRWKSATPPLRRKNRLSPPRREASSSIAANASRSVEGGGGARSAGRTMGPEAGAAASAGVVEAPLRPAHARGRRCDQARPALARSSAPARWVYPYPCRRR